MRDGVTVVGVPVPSTFAAAYDEGVRQLRAIEGPERRPVPFD